MQNILKIVSFILIIITLIFAVGWWLDFGNFELFLAVISAVLSFVAFVAGNYQKEAIDERINQKTDTENLSKMDSNQNLKELDQPNVGDEAKKSVNRLQQKFFEIFKKHGIDIAEIPRVLPDEFEITLSDISNSEKLVCKLKPQIIDWCCETFNVRREWFEKNNEKIYRTNDYYKDVGAFLRLIKKLKEEHYDQVEIYCLKSVKELDFRGERPQNVVILISVPALSFEKQIIKKYIPTITYWDWGYWRTRYQFKSIIRICEKNLNVRIHGYDLSSEMMEKLVSGNIFPSEIVNDLFGYTWYPEDYADLPSESQVAKETDETDEIIAYIKEQEYLHFLKG